VALEKQEHSPGERDLHFTQLISSPVDFLIDLRLLLVQFLHHQLIGLVLRLFSKFTSRNFPILDQLLQLLVEGNASFGLVEPQVSVDYLVWE
jgi:hypothetical protein